MSDRHFSEYSAQFVRICVGDLADGLADVELFGAVAIFPFKTGDPPRIVAAVFEVTQSAMRHERNVHRFLSYIAKYSTHMLIPYNSYILPNVAETSVNNR